MPDTHDQEAAISFGPFELFRKSRLLEKDGSPLHIGGRALDILVVLSERPGEVIDKRELVKRVWGSINVDEGSLRFQISALRKALGDGGEGARYVVNVPGRGYCFAAPIASAAPARPQATARAPASVPAPLSKIVGRAETIEKISKELALHRFVTVVGPGGIGKTSVAIAVAHHKIPDFGGTVAFVDFSSLRDIDLVPETIASTLGLTVSSNDPIPSLIAFLQGKRVLLVLDSCEHVLENLAPLAERIIHELPELHILATSRESFRSEGERVFRLFPLSCPPADEPMSIANLLKYPAAQLFVERISESLSDFELSEDEAPMVAEICRRMDGIALAIELAAGRVNAYGIAGTSSLIDSRFSLQWRGRRTAIPRHQTLSAALGWSYDLLPADESAVLCILSIFVGPFTLDAALAVLSRRGIAETDAVEAISNLLSKSLLATPPIERQLRYRLLDTTRNFVADKLAESGDTDQVARAHAEYFCELLNDIAIQSAGWRSSGGYLAHADHLPNIRKALEWSFSAQGTPTIGVELAASAAQFFLELSLLTECHHWTQQAIDALDKESIGSRLEMQLQAALGVSVMFSQGNTNAVQKSFARSLELAEQLGDVHWQLWLLRGLHIFLTRIGDFHGALQIGERGKPIAQMLNDAAGTLNVEWMLGVAHHLIGNQAKAVELCESARVQNPSSQKLNIFHLGYDDRIVALVALARGLWLSGHPDRAKEVARYTVDEAEQLKQPLTQGIALIWTIYVFLWVGDWATAEIMIDRLIHHSSMHFLGPYHAVGIGQKGELLMRRGNLSEGIEHLRRSQAMLHATRHRIMTTVFATALAEALAKSNQPEEALFVINNAIDQVAEPKDTFDMPEMLRVKGAILAQSNRLNEAEGFLQQSLELARKQSAIGWELRSATTLGTLWKPSRHSSEIDALIEPLLNRYEDGFDSIDLIAARELLTRPDRQFL